MTGLCAIFFIGPWFREFIGLFPLLIIFLEVQKSTAADNHNDCCRGVFYPLYFSSCARQVDVYPDLPVYPVFAMGHLGHQVAANIATDRVFSMSELFRS